MMMLRLAALLTTMAHANSGSDPDALREPDVRIVHRFGPEDALIARRAPPVGVSDAPRRETLRRRVKGVVSRLTDPEPVAQRFAPYSEGLSHYNDGREHGFVDLKGRRLKSGRLAGAGDFHEGLARALPEGGTGLWGYLDPKGRLRVEARFVAAADFSQGLAVAAETGPQGPRFGAIDKSGRAVVPFEYRQLGDFHPSSRGPAALGQRADGEREIGLLAADGGFTPIPGATDLAFFGSAHDKDIRVAGVKDSKGRWGFMPLGTPATAYVEPPSYSLILVPGIEREDGEFNAGAARTLARDDKDRGWVIDLATGHPLAATSCRDALLPYGGEDAGIACLGEDGTWEEIGFTSGITRPIRPETRSSLERKSHGAPFPPWTRPGALGVWR